MITEKPKGASKDCCSICRRPITIPARWNSDHCRSCELILSEPAICKTRSCSNRFSISPEVLREAHHGSKRLPQYCDDCFKKFKATQISYGGAVKR